MALKNLDSRILMITDDLASNQVWEFALTQQSYGVTTARNLDEALEIWSRDNFDVILINTYGSAAEAITICRQLRPEVTNPILLFLSENRESLLVEGYMAGADECIAKPIGHRLFAAKIRAWARRSWTVSDEALDLLVVEHMRLNPADRHLTIGDRQIIKLSNLEFRVLYLLMSHRGQVLETNTIVDRVWGHTGSGDGVLLKNVVYRLRKKIEENPGQPRYLHTFQGGGYSFRLNG